jgi:hypothetical protein
MKLRLMAVVCWWKGHQMRFGGWCHRCGYIDYLAWAEYNRERITSPRTEPVVWMSREEAVEEVLRCLK